MNATDLNIIITKKERSYIYSDYYKSVKNLMKSGYSYFRASCASMYPKI